MKIPTPLTLLYLGLNLFFPLIYLGYTLVVEQPENATLILFFFLSPIYAIYGTLLLLDKFPKKRGQQLREFVPFILIFISTGFILKTDIFSTFLFSAVILFLMMTVIFLISFVIVTIQEMGKDTFQTKFMKCITIPMLFTPIILMSHTIYNIGLFTLLDTQSNQMAHSILIMEIAVAALLNVKTFINLHPKRTP